MNVLLANYFFQAAAGAQGTGRQAAPGPPDHAAGGGLAAARQARRSRRGSGGPPVSPVNVHADAEGEPGAVEAEPRARAVRREMLQRNQLLVSDGRGVSGRHRSTGLTCVPPGSQVMQRKHERGRA